MGMTAAVVTEPEIDENERIRLYLRYLIHKGGINRYGWGWETPERLERIETELEVIEEFNFSSYFIMLAEILDFCRREQIPYGPGRGSVGGSFVCYLVGIHEIDSIEFELSFERFLNRDRISYPDVDIDVSQRDRPRVIEFIQERMGRDGNTVLQVAAFARAGGRRTIDNMLSALGQTDPSAGATAENLKKCLPKGGNITGGTKQARELAWWLENGHGDKKRFREIAEQAGWLDTMLMIDGMFTNLAKHAAGVVILNPEDLKRLPMCSTDGEAMMTGFDMYALDALEYLKWDILGLRTMDIVSDANKFDGGNGTTPELMDIWREHRDDPEPYELLSEGDTFGIFQFDTPGFRKTVRDFKPTCFDHLVQLTALYRPGMLDYQRPEDGKNMVEVYIERRHGREVVTYPDPDLKPVLESTYGIMLYQEQLMKTAQVIAGFTGPEADTLRKAVGKKLKSVLDELKPKFYEGARARGKQEAVIEQIWLNIEAAARYSWNKSHAAFYGAITWFSAWYKTKPPCFYPALFNSFDKDKDPEKLANGIAEARQRTEIIPPDVNVAEGGFLRDGDSIVFGFNGISGMGEKTRDMVLTERLIGGPFQDFEDLCMRLPSLSVSIKLALIRCGAFDRIDSREKLLAETQKPGNGKKCAQCEGTGHYIPDGIEIECEKCEGKGAIPVIWTVAQHINHNRNLKTPRPVPPVWELKPPTATSIAQGELDTMGFYISATPLEAVGKALARCPKGNTWGGEIASVRTKNDRRGREMAFFTILTPALTKERITMFSSVYDRYGGMLEKGRQVLLRGREDGGSILCDAVWDPNDVRHFKKAKIERGSNKETVDVENTKQILELERAGYTVKLL